MRPISARRRRIAVAAAALAAAIGALAVICSLGRLPGPRAAVAARAALSGAGCKDCNVLLITFESLRADRLKCYGYGADPTPNACALAEAGVLFERAYTPAPATIPALEAIMTGDLIANEDRLEVVAHYYAASSRTIAAGLGGLGYETIAITDHEGLDASARPRPNAAAIAAGFAERLNFGEGTATKTSARAVAAAELWMGEHRDRKFFLWAHLFDPHFNWVPGAATARRFGFREGACGRVRNGIDIAEIRGIESGLSPAELLCLEALYLAEVFETDALVGRLVARLEALGLAERTVVIFAGDHGEEFGERGHVGHELTAYDELLHVPFIVRDPRSKSRGRCAEPISTRVIHDYVLAAAAGRRLDRLPPVVSRTFHYYRDDKGKPQEFRAPPNDFALFRGDLKLVFTPRTGARALYDLAADPGERADVFSGHPEGARMQGALDEWLRTNRAAPDPASEAAIRSYLETFERLKKLGYM